MATQRAGSWPRSSRTYSIHYMHYSTGNKFTLRKGCGAICGSHKPSNLGHPHTLHSLLVCAVLVSAGACCAGAGMLLLDPCCARAVPVGAVPVRAVLVLCTHVYSCVLCLYRARGCCARVRAVLVCVVLVPCSRVLCLCRTVPACAVLACTGHMYRCVHMHKCGGARACTCT